MSTPAARTCRTCGATVASAYCGECGERWITAGGEPFGAVVGTWLGDYLGTDGRVWRTMAAAVFQPGRLTRDYLDGRRRPWLRPLQLFVVCNVLYFLLQPFTSFNAFSSTLRGQVERQYYSESLRPTVDGFRAVKAAELTAVGVEANVAVAIVDDVVHRRFDERFQALSKAALIALVPLLALGLAIVAPRAGPNVWLVLALHYLSALLLGLHLAWAGLLRLVWPLVEESKDVRWFASEGASLALTGLLGALALRTLDGRAWWQVALTAAFLGLWVSLAMIAYRYALFWWTWSAVD